MSSCAFVQTEGRTLAAPRAPSSGGMQCQAGSAQGPEPWQGEQEAPREAWSSCLSF